MNTLRTLRGIGLAAARQADRKGCHAATQNDGQLTHEEATRPCSSSPPARLDADRTAQPLTRLISHPREGDVVAPGRPLVDPELEEVGTGQRTALLPGGRVEELGR